MGENCEQLWALLRPLLKLTRYMTKDAYIFCLDDALLLVAEGRLQRFIESTTQQQAALEEKLSELSRGLMRARGKQTGAALQSSEQHQWLPRDASSLLP